MYLLRKNFFQAGQEIPDLLNKSDIPEKELKQRFERLNESVGELLKLGQQPMVQGTLSDFSPQWHQSGKLPQEEAQKTRDIVQKHLSF